MWPTFSEISLRVERKPRKKESTRKTDSTGDGILTRQVRALEIENPACGRDTDNKMV